MSLYSRWACMNFLFWNSNLTLNTTVTTWSNKQTPVNRPREQTNKQTPISLLLKSNNQALLIPREHWKILFPEESQRLCLRVFKTKPLPLILIVEKTCEREMELHKNWPVGGSRAWEGSAGVLQEMSPKLSEFEWLTTTCLQFLTLRSLGST